MRALPLSFIKDDDLLEALAIANADSTHPHPKARTSSIGVALAGKYFMIEKKDPASIISDVVEDLKLRASKWQEKM